MYETKAMFIIKAHHCRYGTNLLITLTTVQLSSTSTRPRLEPSLADEDSPSARKMQKQLVGIAYTEHAIYDYFTKSNRNSNTHIVNHKMTHRNLIDAVDLIFIRVTSNALFLIQPTL